MTDDQHVWPDRLMIRDTKLHDDMGGGGQRIYTTAGQGYAKREYVRVDLAKAPIDQQERIDDLRNLLSEWMKWFGSTNGLSARSRRAISGETNG